MVKDAETKRERERERERERGREGKRPTTKEYVYSTSKRVKEERNVSGLEKGHSSRRVCCQGEKFSPCPTKAMGRCPKDGE